jgi:hypothetical protein
LKPCQTYRNINGGVKYLGHGFVLILWTGYEYNFVEYGFVFDYAVNE